jgi:chromate transporter
MDEEVVRRRGWLSRDEFLDLIGAANLIPGPNSTEVAIYVGQRRAGWPGLLVAGACFILPAALLASAIGWIYVRAGTLPAVQGVLYGIKPVIVAIILQALWALGRTAIKSPALAVLAALALAASATGVHELWILLAAGVLTMIGRRVWRGSQALAAVVAWPAASAASPVAMGAWPLFLLFLKVGSVLFGSGYVLLAFLRADLVERLGWMTDAQLLDAIAVGQMTPGPVFTTATFIGFVLGGPRAAAAATVGIFLPAFVLVALTASHIPGLRRSRVASALLDGVNVASLALMASVTIALAPAALVDAPTIGIALAAAALLCFRRLNSAWLVLGGAIAGGFLSHA